MHNRSSRHLLYHRRRGNKRVVNKQAGPRQLAWLLKTTPSKGQRWAKPSHYPVSEAGEASLKTMYTILNIFIKKKIWGGGRCRGEKKKSGNLCSKKWYRVLLQEMELRAIFLSLVLFWFPRLLCGASFGIQKTFFLFFSGWFRGGSLDGCLEGSVAELRQLPGGSRMPAAVRARLPRRRPAWLLAASPAIALTSRIHWGQSVSQIPSRLDTVFDGRSSSWD